MRDKALKNNPDHSNESLMSASAESSLIREECAGGDDVPDAPSTNVEGGAFDEPSSTAEVRRLANAPQIVEFGLVLVLAVLIARVFWIWFAPLDVAGEPISYEPSSAGIEKNIVVRSPFGADTIDVADTAPVADVRETTLNLKLFGVFIANDNASATIGPPSGRQRVYRIGDEIQRGVTLQAIYPNQVTISSNGVLESLKLPKQVASPPVTNAAPATDVQAAPEIRDEPFLSEASSEVSIMDYVNFVPGGSDASGLSILLYPGRDPSLFNAFGLEEGDRLISVDGVSLTGGLANISSLVAGLQNKSSVEIVVERDGDVIPITLEFSAVDATGVN